MFFNSIDFALFLPLVFALYWLIPGRFIKIQNILIVVASYVFYGWWDWRFLFLIFFSTVVDFSIGLALKDELRQSKRKTYLWMSLIVNLGLLGFFKYFNFFLDNFVAAFTFFGYPIGESSLNIILPVGISFYTFQTLSYTIDVYRRNLEPTKDFVAFTAFVSFFPQLVAGPIERATNLLPQFSIKREFNQANAIAGLQQILWGLFKKTVIADNCAVYANMVFENPASQNGSTLAIGAVMFAFQIYGDFSGYSDIAIGTSRLFGFNLMQNFATPYFARDMAEFWRRWHISLSTWFRDYLYIPLGGGRGTRATVIRNTFVIFLVSGFWHGANWTFVVWGGLHALYFLPLLLLGKNRRNLEVVAQGSLFPSMMDVFNILSTFILSTLAWIFFRAANLTQAFDYIGGIFNDSILKSPELVPQATTIFLLLFIVAEWLGREHKFALAVISNKWNRPVRWAIYMVLIICIFFWGTQDQEFIYFQF
ncbi:MAG: MBOAT family protein [Flavobacteriales bacterium]|nr:MBOAT family protein [Flavobacteriales bacterium]